MSEEPGEKSLYEAIFPSIAPPIERPGEHLCDIAAADRAARIIHHVFECIETILETGITTHEIADWALFLARQAGIDPRPIISVSPEEVAWHGPPNDRRLHSGEIFTLDMACSVRGVWVDYARTFPVGAIDAERRNLLNASWKATQAAWNALSECSNGADAIRHICSGHHVALIPQGSGHGVGGRLHMEPMISYDTPRVFPLAPGCLYTAEPVLTSGAGAVRIQKDGSAVTEDGFPTAHFEVTILFLEHGSQILGNPKWIFSKPC